MPVEAGVQGCKDAELAQVWWDDRSNGSNTNSSHCVGCSMKIAMNTSGIGGPAVTSRARNTKVDQVEGLVNIDERDVFTV